MLSLRVQGLLLLAAVSSLYSKSVERAAPHPVRPMYAWAYMGHLSREEDLVLRRDNDELHRFSSTDEPITERTRQFEQL